MLVFLTENEAKCLSELISCYSEYGSGFDKSFFKEIGNAGRKLDESLGRL